MSFPDAVTAVTCLRLCLSIGVQATTWLLWAIVILHATAHNCTKESQLIVFWRISNRFRPFYGALQSWYVLKSTEFVGRPHARRALCRPQTQRATAMRSFEFLGLNNDRWARRSLMIVAKAWLLLIVVSLRIVCIALSF